MQARTAFTTSFFARESVVRWIVLLSVLVAAPGAEFWAQSSIAAQGGTAVYEVKKEIIWIRLKDGVRSLSSRITPPTSNGRRKAG